MEKHFYFRKAFTVIFMSAILIKGYAANTLTVNFTSMNPHVGQLFELRVVDKSNGWEVGRVKLASVPGPSFTMAVSGIKVGGSYMVDFFADLNGNKKYDAPSTDHAWRLNVDNVLGDTTLAFSHNTSFTDIKWPYMLAVNFTSMNPHVGQLFELRVVDKSNGWEVGRVKLDTVPGPSFTLSVPGIQPGGSYMIDFFADLNGNKKYDAPSADHAWRLNVDNALGDTTLAFSHNTSFTDIKWPYVLAVNFTSMNPHVGQLFELRVVDKSNGWEVGRVKLNAVPQPNFVISVPGIQPGGSYMVDFFADLNGNKKYDAPSADHAWRLNVNNVTGDTTLAFSHNTSFTDINWPYVLAVNFISMNPHVGQLFELRVVDKSSGWEVGRVKLNAVPQPNFVLSVPGIQPGGSYMVDFFADLNGNKKYDTPSADHAWRLTVNNVVGDTTLSFSHNTTFTDVQWPYVLAVNFTNMNPHVGQLFELRVVDKSTNGEVGRVKLNAVPQPNFVISVPGIQPGGSYMVDFFADLNGNKKYDAPSADHAWRLNVNNVAGDTTLAFTHNTTFTDVKWPYSLTVDFMNMNPHVGQLFELRVVDKSNGWEVGRVKLNAVPQPNFDISVPGIQPGGSYMVDFFADLNGNKKYDAPSADHAWRLNVDNAIGDTTLTFTHNTTFTDVKWPYTVTVDFMNMNPHVGQLFELRVVDKSNGWEVGRVKLNAVPQPNFDISVPGIQIGGSYMIDFFADLNGNKKYDAPSADHAWRLNVNNVAGDTTLTFTHNTTFTDVKWPNLLTVDFMSMNPHIGQLFELRVIDKADNSETGRVKIDAVPQANFSINVTGIKGGHSYMVDFFADLNGNKKYDAPSADHAWRLNLDNVVGDTTLMFSHNTTFTDIKWSYMLTIMFMNMNPHVGQLFDLNVYNSADNSKIGEFKLDSVLTPNFNAQVPGIMSGNSYRIDFYADLNKNGMYDAPPTDHAWRLNVNNVVGDTSIIFMHNTNFTDISQLPVFIKTATLSSLCIYPNPSSGLVNLRTSDGSSMSKITLYDVTGKIVYELRLNSSMTELDLSSFSQGVYFLHAETSVGSQNMRLIKR